MSKIFIEKKLKPTFFSLSFSFKTQGGKTHYQNYFFSANLHPQQASLFCRARKNNLVYFLQFFSFSHFFFCLSSSVPFFVFFLQRVMLVDNTMKLYKRCICYLFSVGVPSSKKKMWKIKKKGREAEEEGRKREEYDNRQSFRKYIAHQVLSKYLRIELMMIQLLLNQLENPSL